MEKVDVRGLSCPIPVIKTKKALDQGAAQLQIIGDSLVSKENVIKLAKSYGCSINIKLDQKEQWEIEINR
ncbi:MAG: sulfurtransferase TusA family protein [Syntrophomonadaceae bacterium]